MLGAEHHALEVDIEHFLDGRCIGILGAPVSEDAGVVDQHIDLAKSADRLCKNRGPLVVIGHIVPDEQRLAALRGDVFGQRLAVGFAQVGGNHGGAGCGEQAAGG